MKRIWILEEEGDTPYPKFQIPLEWNLVIYFNTDQRNRSFRVIHISDDSNSIPQYHYEAANNIGFDEWNW